MSQPGLQPELIRKGQTIVPTLSPADHSVSPPKIHIPREYNAAYDLIERNLAAGRAGKVAFVDDAGETTFGELAERVNRFGSGLRAMGLEMEQRVLLALTDTIDFPTAFLGAIKAGIIPVAVNTLLTAKDYEYMLSDSRARALVVSEQLLPQFAPLLPRLPFLKHVIVSDGGASGHKAFGDVLAKGSPELSPAPTTCDDPCFWMYSSGSTGMLHMFISARPGDVRYGATGKPVPGYELRLVDEQGAPVGRGEIGELQVSGPTSAACYWNNREKSRSSFIGSWFRSGDKFRQDVDGYFVYAGRSDDMLRVSGFYVSPAEVEAALVSHEAVLEAAVVGHEDDNPLIKPQAFVF